jgi:MFS family permease
LVSRRLEGSGQGAALGSLQGLQSAGSFLGPPLAGLAYETLGRRSPFWLAIALMLAVALLVADGLPRSDGLPRAAGPTGGRTPH